MLKSYILILLGMLLLTFKFCLIFWMSINYEQGPSFKNVFWVWLRIPHSPLKVYMHFAYFTAINIVTKLFWVATNDFISLSLEFSSFFKYSTFLFSKSVLLFWITSVFFKTWFRESENVFSLLSIIAILVFTNF